MPYFPAIGYVHEAGDLKRVSTGMRRSTWKFTGGSVTPKIDEDANATGTYVLFTDADLSTPLEELYKLSDIAERDRADIVIGSRAIDRRYIERHQSRFREVGGIIFNRMVRMLLGLNLYDTQCGFKVFHLDRTRWIFEKQTIHGFGFDPEILFVAARRGLLIREVPVR